jgi:5'-nucleotidase
MLLLTNDDGVHAPGLQHLAAHLRAHLPGGADLMVVAPEEEQSAKSHALTLHHPLRHRDLGLGCHAVSGTPADCVYVAVHHLCPAPPELVVSGINLGCNLGDDVLYSGTVAAAREGALLGFPALAVSLHIRRGGGALHREAYQWETAAVLAARVIARMRQDPLPARTLLNLNVPDLPIEAVRGLRIAPLGRREYVPGVKANRDPRGREYLWIGGEFSRFHGGPDTDGELVDRGYATLTPLQPDTTDHAGLAQMAGWSL